MMPYLSRVPQSYFHIALFMTAFFVFKKLFFHCFYWGFSVSFPFILQHLTNYLGIPTQLFPGVPYFSAFMLGSALSHPIFLLMAIALSSPLFFFHKKCAWKNFESGSILKVFFFLTAVFISWKLVTYDYNFFLDQTHYLDRLLVALCLLLVWLHPTFLPVFMIQVLLVRSQFTYPLGDFPLIDEGILLDLIILFYTFLMLRLMIKIKDNLLLFMLFCFLGSYYFVPGIMKVIRSPHGFEWVIADECTLVIRHSILKGWLNFADPELLNAAITSIKPLRVPLQAIILLIELSGVLLLARKKLSVALIVAFLFLHIGFFLGGSVLFWQWMVADLLFVFLLVRMPAVLSQHLFTKKNFYLSVAVIILSLLWLRPPELAWFDTRTNTFFTYAIEDSSGSAHPLRKDYFSPYDRLIKFDRFHYLIDKPVIKTTAYGGIEEYEIANAIRKAGAENFQNLEKAIGRNYFNLQRATKYEDFLRTFIKNKNNKQDHKLLLSVLQPPPLFFTNPKGEVLPDDLHIYRLIVKMKQPYLTENETIWMGDAVIMQIVID